MNRERLKDIVKKLAKLPLSPSDFKRSWGILLSLLDLTHSEIVMALVDALDSPSEDLGLTQDELVSLAEKIGLKQINKLVFKKLSPNMQRKHEKLAEDSFTSTANTAPYPVPIGDAPMMRRVDPTGKKRK